MIDPTVAAQIQRLYTQDAWPIGSIVRELKLHKSTVERIVRSPIESRPSPVRGTIFDDHRTFIDETLERWPELPARRLFDMCVERGFVGSPSHFRAMIRSIRPGKTPEAFLRLDVDPAQQGQVDWGHFGHVVVGRSRRQLQAFVIALSWSRMILVRFFLGAAMPCFLRGHTEALDGTPPIQLMADVIPSSKPSARWCRYAFAKYTLLAGSVATKKIFV
ncbi:MAG: transposase [Planctomycetota bacterium]|jgi:transposase